MKFTYSWLKDYLKGDFTLDDVLQGLVNIGLEVESVTDEAKRLKDFIVAEITDTRLHPTADRLQICTVSIGSSTEGKHSLELVCGGKNARVGIKVVLAPVGAVIPSTGHVLKAGKVRGVDSPGMLCSSDELLINLPCEGILELETDVPIGSPAAKALGLDDPVIDVAITPNRSDCFSVFGIAHDLYAYFRTKGIPVTLKPLVVPPEVSGNRSKPPLKIVNNAPQVCRHFGLTYVKNVMNGQSPKWMSERMRAIGLRPISSLVDITNYLCFDWGRPLHVFDADKVKGDIVLRLSVEGEIFEALDDKMHVLSDAMLVICDDLGIISLAGVMGSKRTTCDEHTKNVLIESAWFDPVTIARTGQKLNIISDARMRFERGVDPLVVEPGMKQAVHLVQEHCGGEASTPLWVQKKTHTPYTVTLQGQKLQRVTGKAIPMETAAQMLAHLGFTIDYQDSNCVSVTVPSWRHDIIEDIDLVEEVVRLRGTEAIQEAPLPMIPMTTKPPRPQAVCAQRLVDLGFLETINFSFIDRKTAEIFGDTDDLIHLKNPITADLTTMRPSLLPSLLKVVYDNQKRAQETIPVFEIAPVYGHQYDSKQQFHCTALWAGKNHPRHWKHTQEDIDVFDIKNHLISLLSAFGVKEFTLQVVTTESPSYYHPTCSAVLKQGHRVLGYFGQIHPKILKHFNVNGSVCAFEIPVDHLPILKNKRGKDILPSYQPVERDFAFIVDQTFEAGRLIQSLNQKLTRQNTFPKHIALERVDLFDVFEGIAGTALEGKKSLAVSLRFQPEKGTLSESELEQIMTATITLIEKETGGILRQ